MSNNAPPNPSDNSDTPPVEQTWELTHSLRTGDSIYINDRTNPLTVVHVRPNADRGQLKEITLTAHNTEYTIKTPNENPNTPVYTWPSADVSHPITEIEPADGTILAQANALDIYGNAILEQDSVDSYPETRDGSPDLNAEDLSIVGDCPACDCLVAKEGERVLCTGCGVWCPIDQWHAYFAYNRATNQEPTSAFNAEGDQTTLEFYEATNAKQPAPEAQHDSD